MIRLSFLLVLALSLSALPALAQVARTGSNQAQQSLVLSQAGAGEDETATDEADNLTLRVYLDCIGGGCDMDYIRTEIPFVDYVRDPESADVHVLVTNQRTGSDGREYTMKFIGGDDFEGLDGELLYSTVPGETDDVNRKGFAQMLKLGLVRYLARSPLADRLVVSMDTNGAARPQMTFSRDPWNFWVFRTSFRTRADGEQANTGLSLDGSFSASRTTEQWKARISASGSYDSNRYEFDDGSTYTALVKDYTLTTAIAKSLGAHWGVGSRVRISSNTYTNQRRVVSVTPSLEYNIFPYSDSTRRQFTLRYTIGVKDVDYNETTIYGKRSESLASQGFAASLDLKQPWGTMHVWTEAAHYLQDMSKYHVSVSGDFEVRVFRGFSLDVGGRTTLVRDQLYLLQGGATLEEILARQRQAATSYQYAFNIGFSYTFGSIYNNVVNSRLSNIF
jgi:hypothetical protein